MAEQANQAPPAAPAPDTTAAPQATTPAPATNGTAAPAATESPTLGEAGGGEDKEQAVPANWPANWREIMAGGDEKAIAKLSRYNSPANVFKAYRAMEQKMSSGELLRSKPTGDPADPAVKQALGEWRAQAGIPEKPEGYLEKIPSGIVIGEQDKPLVESFIKDMHGADVPPAIVHKTMEWYYQNQEKALEARYEADKVNRQQNEDTLRSEWGPEFRSNINAIHSLFDTYGNKEILNTLFTARLADGSPLGDNPDILRFLSGVAREINPAGTVTPIEGKTPIETLKTEMQMLETEMRDRHSAYWRGPMAEDKQQRYRELIEMQQKYERKAG